MTCSIPSSARFNVHFLVLVSQWLDPSSASYTPSTLDAFSPFCVAVVSLKITDMIIDFSCNLDVARSSHAQKNLNKADPEEQSLEKRRRERPSCRTL